MIIELLSAEKDYEPITLMIADVDGTVVWDFYYPGVAMTFLDHEVPKVLKLLRMVLKARGSYYTQSGNTNYTLYGPVLANDNDVRGDEIKRTSIHPYNVYTVIANRRKIIPTGRLPERWINAITVRLYQDLSNRSNRRWILAAIAVKRWKRYAARRHSVTSAT